MAREAAFGTNAYSWDSEHDRRNPDGSAGGLRCSGIKANGSPSTTAAFAKRFSIEGPPIGPFKRITLCPLAWQRVIDPDQYNNNQNLIQPNRRLSALDGTAMTFLHEMHHFVNDQCKY